MSQKMNMPQDANYELKTIRVKKKEVQYLANSFERSEASDSLSSTLRLVRNGKLSMVSSTKPSDEESLIARAIELAPYGISYEVPFADDSHVNDLDLYEASNLTTQQIIERAGDLVSDLKSLDSRLTINTNLSLTETEVALETSLGFNQQYKQSQWMSMARVELVQGDDILSLYKYISDRTSDLDYESIKRGFAYQLSYAKQVVPFNSGSYPVIFAPMEVNNIIAPITASVNGLAVHRGFSLWKDKLGEQVLNSQFSLVDDGSIIKRWTSVPFDAEGVPTRNNILIQNGVIQSFLTDRKVALALGSESTGNSIGAMLAPYHLMIPAGDQALNDLIRSIDCGLIIYHTMGSWSANPYNGVVTGTISMGLKIEKGEIVGRIKDCMFSLNAFQHFKDHFSGASLEIESARAHDFPYVLLDNVVITTK